MSTLYLVIFKFFFKNTPGVKKEQTKTKRPCWKKYEIKMGGQGLLFLIRLKFWSSWPHCKTLFFGCSRSSDVDRIKTFDKDDQAGEHCSFTLIFCNLVIFIKILIPSTSRDLEHPSWQFFIVRSWWSKF